MAELDEFFKTVLSNPGQASVFGPAANVVDTATQLTKFLKETLEPIVTPPVGEDLSKKASVMPESKETLTGFVGTPEQEEKQKTKITTSKTDLLTPDIDITKVTSEQLAFAMNQMTVATDGAGKVKAAIAVHSLAESLMAMEMPTFQAQAQASLGIPDMEAQIQAALTADMNSPFNPGDGSHSDETQQLMDKKAQRMLQAPQLAVQLANISPKYAVALSASQAILKSLPAQERLEISQEKSVMQSAMINSITATEAKNYAAINGQFSAIDWNNPMSVQEYKTAIFKDKEFMKMKEAGTLDIEDPAYLRVQYGDAKDAVTKNRSLAMLSRLEYDTQGVNDPNKTPAQKMAAKVQAEENLLFFRGAYSTDKLTSKDQKAMQQRLTTETTGLTGDEKKMKERSITLENREKALFQESMRRFSSDVSQWKGIDYDDPLVTQALAVARKTTGKQAVPVDLFMSTYLSIPSNGSMRDKVGRVQSYIRASAKGSNTSAVLPELNPENLINATAPSTVSLWLKQVMGQVQ